MKHSVKYDEIKHITVENDCGMKAEFSAYGASIYNIWIKNNEGVYESMVLTPSLLSDFYTNTSYHGKTIGRYSGRIDKGICEINNIKYNLDINWNNVNSLHGGFNGLSSKVFEYVVLPVDDCIDILFWVNENDNILGGNALYNITYRISKNYNTITIFLNATCDIDTIMNLTNHTYFNLSGNCKNTILNHKLYLPCNKYTRLNNELITLSIDEVDKITDFREKHEIGLYIEDPTLQNHTSKGYDHCFIKENPNDDLTAILEDSLSGNRLTISSSYPSVVFYSGCYPDSFKFNEEKLDNIKYHALCLEPQFIPNGINMTGVDKAILKANTDYRHYIKFEFSKI